MSERRDADASVGRPDGEQRDSEVPAHARGHLSAAPMAVGRTGPLADVRIVDLTQALAGPFCTMILADMGADVVKVEPPGGDGVRVIGPHTEVDHEHHFGGYFASVNRNKRSVMLDLTQDADRERLLRLVDTADVLVENYRAGVMDRLGLSYEALHVRNPRLVYAAIRGFGDPRTGAGPATAWPAYDIVAQSMGGLVSFTGTTGGEHVAAGASVGDLYPATLCAVGVLGALHHARTTGVGQFVDVGMMDSIVALCDSMVWRYSYTGEIQAPRGAEHPSLCPFELYHTSDGMCAIAAPGPKHWAELCTVVGREDLIDTDATRSARRRVLNRQLVREAIEGWSTQRSTAEVVEALAGKVPIGPVNNAPMLFSDPHVRERQMLVAIEHPGSERPVVTPNTPIRFGTTPGGVYRRAPLLGEHDDEVFAELDAGEDA
jgi:crotonobetainyl-CoA:carnitine CoA-transferase CaiB-like acyl-CoA transferase